jgi:hypothetical protein
MVVSGVGHGWYHESSWVRLLLALLLLLSLLSVAAAAAAAAAAADITATTRKVVRFTSPWSSS